MLISILLGLAVVLSLSDAADMFFQKRKDYVATFDVASGVANLQPGSTVRVGGLTMGNVQSVEPSTSSSSGKFGDVIEVRFALDDRYELFTDARVYVGGPLIGSDAWLEIVDFGGKHSNAAAASAEVPIVGEAASMLQALIGADGGRILASVAAFTDELPGYNAQIENILGNTETITDNVALSSSEIRELVSRVRQEDWPQWASSVSTFLTWTNDVADDLDRAVASGNDLLTAANDVIGENRPGIRAVVDNVEQTTASSQRIAKRFEEHTLGQAEQLLAKGQSALDSATGVLEQVQVDYPQWGSSLTHTMANGNLASQQLKLAVQEIRRNPWKLLYQPAPDELDFELLYDAARSFSLATVDLRAASESLERSLQQHGSLIDERGELAERVTRGVLDSLENYEKAQRRLFEVLKLDAPKSP